VCDEFSQNVIFFHRVISGYGGDNNALTGLLNPAGLVSAGGTSFSKQTTMGLPETA
jgi:hypothetical protein